jgi:hypothetical protein
MPSTANSYTTGTLGFTEDRFTFNKAERKMSEHPGSSVLTAFGMGFIIAKLLGIGKCR